MASSVALWLYLSSVFFGLSASHFLLNYPPTIGFDDNLETTPPCGSFTVDFTSDNVTDFYVGGSALAVTSIHPQATWLFRATLNLNASGNWTTLLPAVQQTGLGSYCEPAITVPPSFAGSKGVVQVVQDAPDGILYQCAAVNFVAGSNPPPSVCSNVTGLTASYTTDTALSSLPATATSTAAASSSAASSSSSSSASASSTPKPSSANMVNSFSGLGAVVWLALIACGTVFATLL